MGISIETLAAARKYAKKAAKEEGVNQSFLDDFVTNKTTAEFCKSITDCPAVKQGNSFMGAVTLTDMPFMSAFFNYLNLSVNFVFNSSLECRETVYVFDFSSCTKFF